MSSYSNKSYSYDKPVTKFSITQTLDHICIFSPEISFLTLSFVDDIYDKCHKTINKLPKTEISLAAPIVTNIFTNYELDLKYVVYKY